MEEVTVVRALAALAQPVRLRVFRALVSAGPCGLVPGTLSECLAVPATTLSFHLKELVNAQLVSQERDGRFLIYRASVAHMDQLLGYLTSHCCHGQACAVGPAQTPDAAVSARSEQAHPQIASA
jgi:DNA-binding transcriptional ArsR family regulator